MTCIVIHKVHREKVVDWLSDVSMPYWESSVMDPSETAISFYCAEDYLAFILQFDELVGDFV